MSSGTKAQAMGEARDRDAMTILIKSLRDHSDGDQQAIRNFCQNQAIKDGVKPARINMYNEAASRSLFIEGLPIGTSRDLVKALLVEKLRAAKVAVAKTSSFELCSVFVNKPPEHTEFMYAIATLNDIKHAEAILGVMDTELETGTHSLMRIDGIGISVQLRARAGEAPTAQALARAYLQFIQDKRHKSDLRRGIVPKLPPKGRTMVVRPAPVVIPAAAPAPTPTGLRVCPETGLLLHTAPTAPTVWQQRELPVSGATGADAGNEGWHSKWDKEWDDDEDEDKEEGFLLVCGECDRQRECGHTDPADGKWYCDGCWARDNAKHTEEEEDPAAAAAAAAAASTSQPPVGSAATLHKAFSKATPKKMAVFHDAENCYLGKAKSGVSDGDLAYNFHKAVTDMVKEQGGDGRGSWQFFLHHQEHVDTHPSKLTMTELSSLGVDNIDPGPKSGAVDMKMKDNIAMFCDANKDKSSQFIVVILSGDKDFLPEIRVLQRAGFMTIVCHPPEVSKAVLRQAKESGPVYGWQPIRQQAGGLEWGAAKPNQRGAWRNSYFSSGTTAGGGNFSFADRYGATKTTQQQQQQLAAAAPAAAVGSAHFSSHDTNAQQWKDLAAIRKGGGSGSCGGGSSQETDTGTEAAFSEGGYSTQEDDDGASDVSLTSASQMSQMSGGASSVASAVFDEASSPPSSPSVSVWLSKNNLDFAAAALEEFGYDDDMTLLDLTEDVKVEETLREIIGVIDGIEGARKPQVNKIKRELNKLAATGEGVAAASA
jgi:hypothetical protein